MGPGMCSRSWEIVLAACNERFEDAAGILVFVQSQAVHWQLLVIPRPTHDNTPAEYIAYYGEDRPRPFILAGQAILWPRAAWSTWEP